MVSCVIRNGCGANSLLGPGELFGWVVIAHVVLVLLCTGLFAELRGYRMRGHRKLGHRMEQDPCVHTFTWIACTHTCMSVKARVCTHTCMSDQKGSAHIHAGRSRPECAHMSDQKGSVGCIVASLRALCWTILP
jgi:hypothetical protein